MERTAEGEEEERELSGAFHAKRESCRRRIVRWEEGKFECQIDERKPDC